MNTNGWDQGDTLLIRQRDNGATFPALCTRVTRGGRIECVWERREQRTRGSPTKPALLDPLRFEILGFAPDTDADRLWGMQR